MKIDLKTGLLTDTLYHASPNHDDRPESEEVDLLVIHSISLPPGVFGGSEIKDFFLNQLDCDKHHFFKQISHLKVSSHLLIRRDGEIVQFVPFHKRAWHAGESFFRGREKCNDFSIGIELEGLDTIPYTQAQYQALVECTHAIMQGFPKIHLDQIVGHDEIAPGRKTDPGPQFDWQYYRNKLSIKTSSMQKSV